jgi:hypothetical protein
LGFNPLKLSLGVLDRTLKLRCDLFGRSGALPAPGERKYGQDKKQRIQEVAIRLV